MIAHLNKYSGKFPRLTVGYLLKQKINIYYGNYFEINNFEIKIISFILIMLWCTKLFIVM